MKINVANRFVSRFSGANDAPKQKASFAFSNSEYDRRHLGESQSVFFFDKAMNARHVLGKGCNWNSSALHESPFKQVQSQDASFSPYVSDCTTYHVQNREEAKKLQSELSASFPYVSSFSIGGKFRYLKTQGQSHFVLCYRSLEATGREIQTDGLRLKKEARSLRGSGRRVTDHFINRFRDHHAGAIQNGKSLVVDLYLKKSLHEIDVALTTKAKANMAEVAKVDMDFSAITAYSMFNSESSFRFESSGVNPSDLERDNLGTLIDSFLKATTSPDSIGAIRLDPYNSRVGLPLFVEDDNTVDIAALLNDNEANVPVVLGKIDAHPHNHVSNFVELSNQLSELGSLSSSVGFLRVVMHVNENYKAYFDDFKGRLATNQGIDHIYTLADAVVNRHQVLLEWRNDQNDVGYLRKEFALDNKAYLDTITEPEAQHETGCRWTVEFDSPRNLFVFRNVRKNERVLGHTLRNRLSVREHASDFHSHWSLLPESDGHFFLKSTLPSSEFYVRWGEFMGKNHYLFLEENKNNAHSFRLLPVSDAP